MLDTNITMEQTHNGTKYKFFWNGIFSNWEQSYFEIDGMEFNCGEQYMMFQKAITFDDFESAEKIMNELSPSKQKKMGRKVKNYDQTTWDLVKYHTVKRGLREKFIQNPDLLEYLKKYEGYEIVEASPYDKVWGIGFLDRDAIENIDEWGENLLGKILMELSTEL